MGIRVYARTAFTGGGGTLAEGRLGNRLQGRQTRRRAVRAAESRRCHTRQRMAPAGCAGTGPGSAVSRDCAGRPLPAFSTRRPRAGRPGARWAERSPSGSGRSHGAPGRKLPENRAVSSAVRRIAGAGPLWLRVRSRVVGPEIPRAGYETARRLRPLARRRFKTCRPFFVLIRTRNPWVRRRWRLFGWKVRFIALLDSGSAPKELAELLILPDAKDDCQRFAGSSRRLSEPWGCVRVASPEVFHTCGKNCGRSPIFHATAHPRG